MPRRLTPRLDLDHDRAFGAALRSTLERVDAVLEREAAMTLRTSGCAVPMYFVHEAGT
jgi:hypothetical protein